ncbi:flagellar export protein FliJ [Anaerobium acetethylicum]|uniref:Flagellar FliJ protein n=1 Tax=Anaerobium acetethylicum TaxID=1619234 RepID=A0A1D3TQN4_9FIRM|nr:flagellar export protein FliJ [Anaerobium acetethylicum]SCP95933.1 flagellar FliJ protein [Anaerobium acetethylicum]
MAKFIYKMQNILDVKYKLEEQAKTRYSEARVRLDVEQEKLEGLRNRKLMYEDMARELMCGILNLARIRHVRQEIERIKEEIKNQLIQIRVSEKNLEQARLTLNEVIVARKTHEKLKEDAFEEFRKELNSQESRENDELVSYSYSNRNS